MINNTTSRQFSKKNLPIYREPVFIIPYIISAIVALTIPEDGINSTAINVFANLVNQIVPSIAAYIKKSSFPEVSKIYFAGTSIIFIPWLIFFLSNKDASFRRNLGYEGQLRQVREKNFPRVFCCFAILFFLLIIVVSWFQPGYDFGMAPINSKRWALAIFGPLFSVFSATAIALGMINSYRQMLNSL